MNALQSDEIQYTATASIKNKEINDMQNNYT